MVNLKNYEKIISELEPYSAKLVAVSKTKSADDIKVLFDHGQKEFGENYVQELAGKYKIIPEIEWHFVGHLQSNKVKFLPVTTKLIHGIDNVRLLNILNNQAMKNSRIQDCLLQIHIAKEETKFGFSFEEADTLLNSGIIKSFNNISIIGLMGITTTTSENNLIRKEFKSLRIFFQKNTNSEMKILSMGMTSDYKIALEEGSTMVRIGSAIFGERL